MEERSTIYKCYLYDKLQHNMYIVANGSISHCDSNLWSVNSYGLIQNWRNQDMIVGILIVLQVWSTSIFLQQLYKNTFWMTRMFHLICNKWWYYNCSTTFNETLLCFCTKLSKIHIGILSTRVNIKCIIHLYPVIATATAQR